MNKNIYFYICIILLSSLIIVYGYPGIINNNKNEIQNSDLKLLAYQLEGEIRLSFQNAYNSWINKGRITGEKEKYFQQIISTFKRNLENFVSDATTLNPLPA